MEKTITFKDWKEASEYILENCEKSCLNCKYGTRGEITESANVFCTELNNGLRMANLNFGIVCSDWKDYKGD